MALPRLCFLGRAQGRLAAPMRTQYRRSTVCATDADELGGPQSQRKRISTFQLSKGVRNGARKKKCLHPPPSEVVLAAGVRWSQGAVVHHGHRHRRYWTSTRSTRSTTSFLRMWMHAYPRW